jgi:hypothetical protein
MITRVTIKQKAPFWSAKWGFLVGKMGHFTDQKGVFYFSLGQALLENESSPSWE